MTARRAPVWSMGAAGPVLADEAHRIHEEDWERYGACAEVDPELFFPPVGVSYTAAKKVCAGCFVRDQCREAGLEHRDGVWGGLGVEERTQERVRRGMPPLPPLPSLEEVACGTRRCAGPCDQELALSEFHRDPRGGAGYNRRCKSCRPVYEASLRKKAAAA